MRGHGAFGQMVVRGAAVLGVCAGSVCAIAHQPESTPPAHPSPAQPPAEPAPAPQGQPDSEDLKSNPPIATPEQAAGRMMIGEMIQKGLIKMPPEFDAQSIVKRDEQGKLVRYDRPLPWVVYDLNPLISDQQRKDLEPVFKRRQMMNELNLVNNLDLALRIEAGEFERIDPRDRRTLAWADRVQKQLRAGGSLSEWMYNQGALTDIQAAGCQLLGHAYTEATLKELTANVKDRPDATKEEKLAASTAVSREMYRTRVDEPMYVFERLLERAADNVDACIKFAELPQDVYASVQPEISAIREAKSDADKRATVIALLNKLPDWVMQHRFLDAAVSVQFSDRSSQAQGRVIQPVMAYQVEEQRRRELAAKGNSVPYQKAPVRPER
ncbi:MAG TPA: hypothetical protein VK176_01000 [Phycisphaerales bacterium]|nr:hypothetical protein [Phycisphaerales bacterium]